MLKNKTKQIQILETRVINKNNNQHQYYDDKHPYEDRN